MGSRATLRTVTAAVSCAAALALVGAGLESSAGATTSRHVRSQPAGTPAGDVPAVGAWTSVPLARHSWRLTWFSPRQLPVGDSRPAVVGPGALTGSTTLSANGRRVSVTVDAASAPDPAAYDVTAGGVLLDQSPPSAPPAAKSAPARPPTTPLADDPGTPGPFKVVSADYRLPATKLPGLPAKVEMLGHVVRPARRDPTDPLVLFLHGRHEACYQTGHLPPGPQPDWPCRNGQSLVPSYLGYAYAQRLLASQGYVTVSISADGINAQDYRLPDGGAGDRALLVRRHLALWAAWSRSGRYAVDMSSVVLVGHSRGGEGVDRASITVPLSAPYTIRGQVLIGPTDFGFQTAPYVPTVTMLPYCDGDVSDLEGQQFTDIARDVVPDDTALHSSVLVMGANHNFFNSEWTPGISAAPSSDDWGGPPHRACGNKTAARLTAAEQRKVGRTYIAGAVHLFARADTGVLAMFDGSAVQVASAGDADVRSEAVGGGRLVRRPGLGATLAPAATATTRICRGITGRRGTRACGQGVDAVRTPHWVGDYLANVPTRPAFEMSWASAGSSGGMVFHTPLDLSAASSLDLRTIVDPSLGAVRLAVRLYDASGDTVVTPVNSGELPALPGGDFYSLGKEWGQTLRVPLAGIPIVRRDAVTRVDLVARTAQGRIWVLDAAAVPTTLPAVPLERAPVFNVHDVTQTEGNAKTGSVKVPYTVRGDLTTSARISVTVTDNFTGKSSPPTTLELSPHTTSGTVDVPYRPNRLDDYAVHTLTVTAFAMRGIMTGSYIGTGRVLDDDPSPRLTVSPTRPRVFEGRPARWTLSLSKPVNYDVYVRARAVRGHSSLPPLTVGDLPKKLRRQLLFPVPPLDTPLWKARLELYMPIRIGHVTGHVTLPTLVRPRPQGGRSITMRFTDPGQPLRGVSLLSSVVVRDR